MSQYCWITFQLQSSYHVTGKGKIIPGAITEFHGWRDPRGLKGTVTRLRLKRYTDFLCAFCTSEPSLDPNSLQADEWFCTMLQFPHFKQTNNLLPHTHKNQIFWFVLSAYLPNSQYFLVLHPQALLYGPEVEAWLTEWSWGPAES